MAKMQGLSIYIHIPFCIRKCFYCDFLSAPADELVKRAYMEALTRELEQEAERYSGYLVESVFIGGGTPSVIESGQMCDLLLRVGENFALSPKAEITIEVNPGTVDEKKLYMYRQAGVNRLSIGLQSMWDEELKALGRIHSVKEFDATFGLARKAGFENINVDLMAALPGQNLKSYKESLRRTVSFAPEHISAYSLIIEEETDFGLWEKQGKIGRLPTEDEERGMDKETEEYLAKKGYHRYEISNYALPGRECRHNTVYWRRGTYAGFGVGAASLVENVRWSNIKGTQDYIRAFNEKDKTRGHVKENREELSIREQMGEFMFLGLRMTNGISAIDFLGTFGSSIESVYGDVLERLVSQHLLNSNGRIFLTPYGRDISNYVMAQFLLL